MNQKIEETLRGSILSAQKYLENTSIRESIEKWKEDMLRPTRLLEQKNDPIHEADIKHNYSVIEYLYGEFISALENEHHYNLITKNALKQFAKLNEGKNIELFATQLRVELPKLRLLDDADSLYGIFFEYDSSPVFGVTCFPKQPFEIIIEEPKYVTYENGSYASDVILEIDFSPFGDFLFSEEFDEINEAFEGEIGFIQSLKTMHINYAYLCLHHALKHPQINDVMNQTPIDPKAIFFAMQHDCEHRTIFIRE